MCFDEGFDPVFIVREYLFFCKPPLVDLYRNLLFQVGRHTGGSHLHRCGGDKYLEFSLGFSLFRHSNLPFDVSCNYSKHSGIFPDGSTANECRIPHDSAR